MSPSPAFCVNCGAKLSADSRFCPECGARLADLHAPTEQPSEGPPIAAQPDDTAPFEPAPVPVLDRAPPAVPPTVPLAVPGPAQPNAAPTEPRGNARLIIGVLIALGALFFGACIGLVLVTLNFSSSQRDSLPEAPVAATAASLPTSAAVPGAGGELWLEETFDDPAASRFGVDETEVSRFSFIDGGYQVEVLEPEYIAWWQVDEQYADVTVSVDAVFPPASLEAAAALIFHYQDADNFYLFSVSNDGYYAFEVKRDGEWTYLIDWTESPEIDAVRNALRVETRGEQIAFYVNGGLLEETIDTTFTSGDVGLSVVSFGEAPAIARFDDLVIARSR